MSRNRYFFVHLQKTGGIALFQRLRDCFGLAAVYPTPEEQGDIRAVTDVDFLRRSFDRHRDELQVVTGHFPLCAASELGVSFTTFTVLREPVERVLSMLRHRKQIEERFEDSSLEEIYEDRALTHLVGNHMVKMLSMTSGEMTSTPLVAPMALDDGHLERAKQNLVDGVDLFGLQEHFDEFCDALTARYGWDLGRPRFAQRTQKQPVSAALTERIAEDNRLDLKLYDFAVSVRDEQSR